MKKKVKSKNEKINFLLESKHYQRLHLYLYFLSVIIIILIYLLTIVLFSKFINILVTSLFSIIIGLFLVFHRDKLVKYISSNLQDKKRKKFKEENKLGLKKTIHKISPSKKSNLIFNIKNRETLKEKVVGIKNKLKKKKTIKKKDYIEIK